jgi:hypothetical protein
VGWDKGGSTRSPQGAELLGDVGKKLHPAKNQVRLFYLSAKGGSAYGRKGVKRRKEMQSLIESHFYIPFLLFFFTPSPHLWRRDRAFIKRRGKPIRLLTNWSTRHNLITKTMPEPEKMKIIFSVVRLSN